MVDSGQRSWFSQGGDLLEDANFPQKLRFVLINIPFFILNAVLLDLGVLILENGHGHVKKDVEAGDYDEPRVEGVDNASGLLDVDHDERPALVGDSLEDGHERPE